LPRADIILRELLRVLSQFAGHLALVQTFENRQTLTALSGSGVKLPPIRDCYERMVRYCLETNWGRSIPQHEQQLKEQANPQSI
jgi:hypothetical protein